MSRRPPIVPPLDNTRLRQQRSRLLLPLLPQLPLHDILLVFFAGSVRQIGGFVGVEGQTQATLVATQVISHNIGIVRDISRLNLQLPQPLLPNHIHVRCRGQPANPSRTFPVLAIEHFFSNLIYN